MVHRHLFKNRAICASAAMIAMFVIAGLAHGGGVLYVDDDAPPGGDGTSWDTAYRFLQDGLTDAAKGDVSEIRVAQGVYKPDRNEAEPDGTGNRLESFDLLPDVQLIGGYAGLGAPDPDSRDVQLYQTILSGDLLGNDGPDFENNDENSFHVVYIETWGPSVITLDGFIIRGGNANLLGNVSHERGGGILNYFDSLLTIVDCTFVRNWARRDGGAVYHQGQAGSIDSTFLRCTFLNNHAIQGGAYKTNVGGVTTEMIECQFRQNSAVWGGAIMARLSANVVLDRCLFEENSATVEGGALWLETHNATEAHRSVFLRNSAVKGGALFGRAIVENCLFAENTAGQMGGVYYGGEVNEGNAYLLMVNCTLADNSAQSGSGGAIRTGKGEVDLRNCILWGNSDSNGTTESSQIFVDDGTAVTVFYSCIQGLTGRLGGEGNIGIDPLFVDPQAEDYRLWPGSPCIDAANNGYEPQNTTDVDGNPRFVDDPCSGDTGLGNSPLVDMGSYEFQCTSCDLDGSTAVDNTDLGDLLRSWGPCTDPRDCPADFDGDGNVGVPDLLILLANWGPCP